MMQAAINLLVALPAEAKPLIAHFGLQRQQPDGGFPLYSAGNITLVRSGVGRAAAAAATRFLTAQTSVTRSAAWLNIGVAGHASRPLGSPILARSVQDAVTQELWELEPGFTPPCDSEQLITLEVPEFDYSRTAAFDMEAAGFIATIKALQPTVPAHCFKVISDNRLNPANGINGRLVRQLITAQIDTIERLLQLLTSAPAATNARQRQEAAPNETR